MRTQYYKHIFLIAFIFIVQNLFATNPPPKYSTTNNGLWISLPAPMAAVDCTLSLAVVSPTNATTVVFSVTFEDISVDNTEFTNAVVNLNGSTPNGTNFGTVGSNQIHTFTISPPFVEGVNIIYIEAKPGKFNQSNTFSFTYDSSAPIPTLSGADAQTNLSTIPITVNLNENVTNFDITDITVTNGIANSFFGSGSLYTFNVVPSANGTVSVDIANNVCSDMAGNPNQSTSYSFVYDTSPPGYSLQSPLSGTLTNANSITLILEFQEEVGSFNSTATIVTNGTAQYSSNSGNNYYFLLAPTSDGIVEATFPAGMFKDVAGNATTSSSYFSINYDGSSPVPSISSNTPTPTNSSTQIITVEFSENVFNFNSLDITHSTGTISAFAQNGTVYTFNMAVSSEGSQTVSIAKDVCEDEAGNKNIAATYNFEYDRTAPMPTLSSDFKHLTSATQIPVTVNFSENVSSIISSDFLTANASVSIQGGENKTYYIMVSPLTDGLLSVALNATSVTDLAGNANSVSNTFTIEYDGSAPLPTITPTTMSINTTTLVITVDFGENVSSLTTNGLTLDNCTAVALGNNGQQYVFNIAKISDGLATIEVKANQCSNLAGHYNQPAFGYYTFDTKQPAPYIFSAKNGDIVNSAVEIEINFKETVNGFTTAGFGTIPANAISSATLTTGEDGLYTANILFDTEGSISIEIPAGEATDNAGNISKKSNSLTFIFDTTKPKPTISSAKTVYTSSLVETIIDFGENIQNFNLSDITYNNGNGQLNGGTNGLYSFNIFPVSDGTISVSIAAGVCNDDAGNSNSASALFTVAYDGTRPQTSISSTTGATATTSPINVIIDFKEEVAPFTTDNIAITNATATISGGTNGLYNLVLTPLSIGYVSVEVAANQSTDAAGNFNIYDYWETYFDDTAPAPTLLTNVNSPTNQSDFIVEIDFGETVNGFDISDINYSGAPASLSGGTNGLYSFSFFASSDGVISMDIPAGKCTDVVNTPNTASPVLTIEYDSTRPQTSISSTTGATATTSPINVIIDFKEEVAPFTTDNIVITNATATISGGTNGLYNLVLTPLSIGTISVEVAANQSTDAAGNFNIYDYWETYFDDTAPAPTLSTSVNSPTNQSNFIVEIDFGETVNGFDISDINYSGAPASLSGGTNGLYSFSFFASSDGVISMDIPAGKCTDVVNTPNTASPVLTIEYDGTKPNPVISSAVSGTANSAPIDITIDFQEDVSPFTTQLINITNATAALTGGTNGLYNLSLTPLTEGTVIVDIPADISSDEAGNFNIANNWQIVYDSTIPTPTISTSVSSPTKNDIVLIEINFGENVQDFSLGDIGIINGTPTNFTGNSGTYYFNLEFTTPGNASVSINSNVCSDDAHNPNNAAIPLAIAYDPDPPTPTITTAQNPTNLSPFVVTVDFGEAVFTFSSTHLQVVSGTVDSYTSTGSAVFYISIIPDTDGDVEITYPANKVKDAAGNFNNATDRLIVNYNSQGFSPLLSSPASDPTNNAVIPISVLFNQQVTGFTADDITLTNATLSNFTETTVTAASHIFTFEANALTAGNVTADIDGGVCTGTIDENIAATQFVITYDNVKPVPTISTSSANPTNDNPVVFIVDFPENVFGFTVDDIETTPASLVKFGFTTINQKKYQFKITPSGDGNIDVWIPADGCEDNATNLNAVSNTHSFIYDSTNPSPSISSVFTTRTNISPIQVTIDFQENVSAITTNNLTLSNCTADMTLVSTGKYETNFYPQTDGNTGFTVPASICTDDAGNNNINNSYSIIFDSTKPQATASSAVSNPTNQSNVAVDILFSEDIQSFNTNGISLTNAVLNNYSGSNNSYAINISPQTDGAVKVQVLATQFLDLTGNSNIASSVYSFTFDSTKPEPTVSSTYNVLTNVSPIPVTIDFGESVNGLSTNNLDLTNCTAQITNAQTSVFTVEITPVSNGQIELFVKSNVRYDDALNYNTQSNTYIIEYDNQSPQADVSSPENQLTNNSSIPVEITFTENVYSFSSVEILVSNASISNYTVVSPKKYTLNLAPLADDLISLDIPAAVCSDAAANDNIASSQFTIEYDGTAPNPTISTQNVSPTNISALLFLLNFGETVSNFTYSPSYVSGGIGSMSGGTNGIYSINVTVISDGTVSVNIPTNQAKDLAGSYNNASNTVNIVYDATKPDANLSSSVSASTNSSVFTVDITFSEPVTGFDSNDISVTNAIYTFSQTDAEHYAATLQPISDGLVEMIVIQNSTTDFAGNYNPESVFQTIYDSTLPAPTIASGVSNPTNQNLITASIDFGETVNGFLNTEIAKQNCTTTLTSLGNGEYSLNISPLTDGDVSVVIPANVCSDNVGNNNLISNTLSFVYDKTAPKPTITSNSPNPTNTSPVVVTIDFGEKITSLTTNNFTVTNGQPEIVSNTANRTFIVEITPLSNNEIIFSVPVNQNTDIAGNSNLASNEYRVIYDDTRLQPLISSTENNLTNKTSFAIKIKFIEDAYGFEENDITVTNASISGFTEIAQTQYQMDILPQSDGEITINVASSKCTDLSGNINIEADEFKITFDGTKPKPTIIPLESSPSNNPSMKFVADFGESTINKNLSINRFTISGANAYITYDDSQSQLYTINLTNQTEGNISVSISGNQTSDLAGNPNLASNTSTIRYDKTRPVPTLFSTENNKTNSNLFVVDIEFNEDVHTFTTQSINVQNALYTLNIIDNMNYNVTLQPVSDGNVQLRVNENAVTDNADNLNLTSMFQILYDVSSPSPSITSDVANPTNLALFKASADFGETVTGFTATDIITSNCNVTIGNKGGGLYDINISPVNDGELWIQIPANTSIDHVTNQNNESNIYSIVYDATPPKPVITTSHAETTNSNPLRITIDFNEEVNGFDTSVLSFSNSTANIVSATGNQIYEIDITPVDDGQILVNLAANQVKDNAGNFNVVSNTLEFNYDSQGNKPNITAVVNELTNSKPFSINVLFNENAYNFDINGIDATNATISGFVQLSDKKYSAKVSATADGIISVSIPPSVSNDLAGNPNLQSEAFTILYDGTHPEPSITAAMQNRTNSAFDMYVNFGEEVELFDVSDFVKNNANITYIQHSGGQYTFSVSPLSDGKLSAYIPANKCKDIARNDNLVSNTFTIVYDGSYPNPQITSPVSGQTYLDVIPLTVDFGEEVNGFATSGLVLTNCNVSMVNNGNGVFRIDVTPVIDAMVEVKIPKEICYDLSGNPNTANSFTILSDRTLPKVSISTTTNSPTKQTNIQFSLVFTEAVNNFNQTDIAVTNGTINFFSGSGTAYDVFITPVTDGIVTLDVPAGVCSDAVNNPNQAAKPYTIRFDSKPPAPNIISTLPNPTNINPMPYTVDFGEHINNFDTNALEVSGGTVSVIGGGSGLYQIEVVPYGDNQVTVKVIEGTVYDDALNPNIASDTHRLNYDATGLTPVLASAETQLTNELPFTLSITFDEDIYQFDIDDITATNAALSNFNTISDKRLFTVDCTAQSDGILSVYVEQGTCIDLVGNPNFKSELFTITYDGTLPYPTLKNRPPDPTNITPMQFMVDFGETVYHLANSDILVTNGQTAIVSQNKGEVAFEVSVQQDATVAIEIPAAVCSDESGNPNIGLQLFTIEYDATKPAPSIQSPFSVPTKEAPIWFTIDFGETISGLSSDDFDIWNVRSISLSQINPSEYQVDLYPSNDGLVSAKLPQNKITDRAGNTNFASALFSIDYDKTPPLPVISTTELDSTVSQLIVFDVDFGEEVYSFNSDNIQVTNGRLISMRQINGQHFNISVQPVHAQAISKKNIKVNIPAAITTDLVGNPSKNAEYNIISSTYHTPCGNITENTIWHTPLVRIYCDVVIEEQATLTINPGTRVEVDAGKSIIINGEMQATNIQFLSMYENQPWRGIHFIKSVNSKSRSVFEQNIIKNAAASGQKSAISVVNIEDFSIKDCEISGNSAGNGGGVFSSSSSLLLSDNTLTNNTAQNGGVIYAIDSDIQFTGNYFKNNTAQINGGAIASENSSLLFQNDYFAQNNAGNNGGAVFAENSQRIDMLKVVFVNNAALSTAGAVYFDNTQRAHIANSLIVNNEAANGGGIYQKSTALRIDNTTIAYNKATTEGGGIYIESAAPNLKNSIVWANSSKQIYINNLTGVIDIAYCDIENGLTGIGANTAFDFNYHQNNNISKSPEFVAAPANNGITSTFELGNWQLKNTSPCVNAGDIYSTVSGLTDLAGNNRAFETTRIDLGVFETQMRMNYHDLLVLQDLYMFTNGDAWKTEVASTWNFDMNNWLTNNPVEQSWKGITIYGGRIAEIKLPNSGLSGNLPASMGELTFLDKLELYANAIGGNLPVETGNLTNLTTLNLNRNKFSGILPDKISEMHTLNTLDVSSNQFSGSVPISINELSNLYILDIHDNLFNELPDLSNASLNNLQLFSVQENYFEFDDIEPNIDISSSYQYTPQYDVNDELTLYVDETGTLSFSVEISGNNLHYKWLLDGEVPRFANDLKVYQITNADFIDEGTYICEVSSDNVPGLTIKRKAVSVTIKTLDVSTEERNVLIEFYNATDGNNWLNNRNWTTEEPVYNWYGVTVQRGKVIRIELPENNLKGFIPASIEKLSYLRVFNLETNSISGAIPPEICNLTNLQFISLQNNQFSGNIPENIGNLILLQELHLSVNSLEGAIPESIGQLTQLSHLALQVNKLSGEIPNLSQLKHLNYLYLENNELNGTIHQSISLLTDLLELNLSGNELSGDIPQNIGDLTKLTRLILNSNSISGSIPPEIGNLTQLIILNLSNNELSGTIPSEISQLSKLSSLQLSANQLEGNIPLLLNNLSNLRLLSLSDNRLSGELSNELFANWLKLKDFLISGNKFSGTVPQNIANLSTLKRIRINENMFDSLPDISRLNQLEELHTQNNNFTFNDLLPYTEQIGFLYSPQLSNEYSIVYIDEGANSKLIVENDAEQYVWKKDNENTSESTNVFSITNATVNHFGYYLCQATHTQLPQLMINYVFSVVVNDTPDVEIPENYCIGDNVITLRDNNNAPLKTYWYWTINGVVQKVSGQVYRFELPEAKDTLHIMVRYETDSLLSRQTTIIELLLRPTIVKNGQTLSVEIPIDGADYQWFKNNVLLPDKGAQITIGANETASYKVSIINNECSATSRELVIIDGIVSGINNDKSTEKAVHIYPNPNNGLFSLKFNKIIYAETTINVRSITGELVFTATYTSFENVPDKIDLKHLSQGLYLMEIKNNKLNETLRFVKY